MTDKTCQACGVPVHKKNVTGYCRDHFRLSESFRKNHQAALRAHFADPMNHAKAKERMLANRATERAKQRRSECAKAQGLYKIGHAAITPEVVAKRGKSIQRARLAHVPRDQWDTYRELVARQHVRKEEALEMVLEKQRVEIIRIRRELMEARGR